MIGELQQCSSLHNYEVAFPGRSGQFFPGEFVGKDLGICRGRS